MDEEIQKEAERKAAEEAKAKEEAAAAKDSDVRNADREQRINETLKKTEDAAEELRKENAEKRALQKSEKELLDKKELAGKGFAYQPQTPERTPEEKAARARIKAVADASGASWGKNYE